MILAVIPKKGILISKSIVIDGKGHTINANKISRIFNITADNVILRNINFINGNALEDMTALMQAVEQSIGTVIMGKS